MIIQSLRSMLSLIDCNVTMIATFIAFNVDWLHSTFIDCNHWHATLQRCNVQWHCYHCNVWCQCLWHRFNVTINVTLLSPCQWHVKKWPKNGPMIGSPSDPKNGQKPLFSKSWQKNQKMAKISKIPKMSIFPPGRARALPRNFQNSARDARPGQNLVHRPGIRHFRSNTNTITSWFWAYPEMASRAGPGQKSAHFFGYLITLPVGTIWIFFFTFLHFFTFSRFSSLEQSFGQKSVFGRFWRF